MQPLTSHLKQAAFVVSLAVVVFTTTAHADSVISGALTVTSISSSQEDSNDGGYYVGPYTVTLNGVPNLAVFCLTGNKLENMGTVYTGTTYSPAQTVPVSAPTTAQDVEEAAFLASYALYDAGTAASQLHNTAWRVTNIFIPVQLSIWEIMGTLGTNLAEYNANSLASGVTGFVALAGQQNYTSTAMLNFLNNVSVFVPGSTGAKVNGAWNTSQSFVTVACNNWGTSTPEPGTMVLFGAGVLLVGLSRMRKH
jgi:hypothetical protein